MGMPPQLQGAAQTEQLAWLTTQASHELVAFVDTISQRLSGYNITSGLQDANTAAEIMTQFRDSKNHNLEQWSDPSTALANFDALCDALGLARQACAADSNHLVCATLAVVDQAKGRQPSPEGYEQARVTMEHKVRSSSNMPCRLLGQFSNKNAVHLCWQCSHVATILLALLSLARSLWLCASSLLYDMLLCEPVVVATTACSYCVCHWWTVPVVKHCNNYRS